MANKSNTQDFIKKAILVHGERYDYSLVNYDNSKKKVRIICPKHGEFQQIPNSHLNGAGCPICSRLLITDKNRLSNEDFIKKANKIHHDKYDYSKTNYINCSSNVKIICPIHGEFDQIADYHLSGNGCPCCGGSVKLSEHDFIQKANKVHHNKYDYSKVEYKNSRSKIVIICSNHGEFQQTPNKHLLGRGCPYCAGNKIPDFEYIVNTSNKVHNNKYKYTKINAGILTIICNDHGEFYQKYNSHINGHGCPKCGINIIKDKLSFTNAEFIDKSKSVHGDKYDYSNIDYINNRSKIEIICSDHGSFHQAAGDHLSGHGCIKCSTVLDSNPILEIKKLLEDNDIDYNENNRTQIKPYEIDLFIPSKMTGIEFHGLHWHSYDKPETTTQKMKHHKKASLSSDAGINLIQIFEHEWAHSKKLIKSMLLNKLHLTKNRIYARNCSIGVPSNQEYREFLSCNHIQGPIGSRHKYGLYHNDELVFVLGINKHHSYDYEIMRVATKINHSVVGGFSKLLKAFFSAHSGKMISYCDRRYSNGLIYAKNGFELSHVTKPSYFYTKNKKVYSRRSFQKHKLKAKLDIFDNNLSESCNMFNNGYRRFWDAGHYAFIALF